MKIIKKILKYLKYLLSKKVITLKPECKSKGNVLISYIITQFLKKRKNNLNYLSHTNVWECYKIANIYLKFGYTVDVINWDNKEFIPKKKYKVFIDIHSNLERLSTIINNDCIKILHITGAHWLYQNTSEYKRLLELQKRKNVTLIPRRIAPFSLGIENADLAIILGNEFTINTFRYASKPMYRIPVSSSVLFDYNENKNFNDCKRNYLWIGSIGLAHKGLDLVLEAFSQLPDYNLTVCGPIKEEKDFEKAYFDELYNTKNINTVGWVDISSMEFKKIVNNCIGVIYPSCSEGGGGSVITCLHAGLIPIVSYEASVDVLDFGFVLKELSIEEIIKNVKTVSSLGINELKLKSKKAWEYARKYHTRGSFAAEYEKFVRNVLKL